MNDFPPSSAIFFKANLGTRLQNSRFFCLLKLALRINANSGIAEWTSGAALFCWGLWFDIFPRYHTPFQDAMQSLLPRPLWISLLLIVGIGQWYCAIYGTDSRRKQFAFCALGIWSFLFFTSCRNNYQSPGTPIIFIWALGQWSACRRLQSR